MGIKEIIKRFCLKKGAEKALEEAMQNGYISQEEILDLLPHELWLDKEGRLAHATGKIYRYLTGRGVIITKKAVKEKSVNDFSILDNQIFRNVSSEDAEAIKKLFSLPEKMAIGHSHAADCAVYFIAYGTLSLDVMEENGRQTVLSFFAEHDLIAPSADLVVTARSNEAYAWIMPYEKMAKLPTAVKNFLKIILAKQNDFLERITSLLPTDAPERIRRTYRFLDNKSVKHIHLIDDDMGTAIGMWREVVTKARRKINKAEEKTLQKMKQKTI